MQKGIGALEEPLPLCSWVHGLDTTALGSTEAAHILVLMLMVKVTAEQKSPASLSTPLLSRQLAGLGRGAYGPAQQCPTCSTHEKVAQAASLCGTQQNREKTSSTADKGGSRKQSSTSGRGVREMLEDSARLGCGMPILKKDAPHWSSLCCFLFY